MQKTAYELRISDWSSDVCSSDLRVEAAHVVFVPQGQVDEARVDVAVAQQQRGAVRAVRLADTGEQFAHGHELILQAEAPVAAQSREVVEAGGHRVDARTDEAVGPGPAVRARQHPRIAGVPPRTPPPPRLPPPHSTPPHPQKSDKPTGG